MDFNSRNSQEVTENPTVKGYQITYPCFVSDQGEFLSHIWRHKRSIVNNKVFLNVSGFKQQFNLELKPNTKLLAPGFKIYHRKRNKRDKESAEQEDIEEDADNVENCLYIGKIRSHHGEPAALTLCDGVHGIIKTTDEDYIIEPIEHHLVQTSSSSFRSGHPHKIYKRSSLDQLPEERYCGKRSASGVFKINTNESEFSHARHKRALYKWFYSKTNIERTVETLVVVDQVMFRNHGRQNITTFTLTLFNMVSQLYQLGSLGEKINIVLVGLILLEGEEPGLSIGHHADTTLNSFCSWQAVLVGANGRQHDHAILLTGVDLCSNKNAPCDTLGFAPIEGMCNRVRSCTINEDTGLGTALTIAHEMGHNFGMYHDGEGNHCTKQEGSVMSPSLMGKNGRFHWSVCSRAYILKFLNTPQSQCLDDKPKFVAEIKFPDKLPGELYNADIQCKWQFGKEARYCIYHFEKNTCKNLWCYLGKDQCESKFLPAAEGTSCGPGMWCRHGSCISFGENGPKPIDGGWSSWSEMAKCSRSCGGGITSKQRECNQPFPQYGGKSCKGTDKVHKLCNIQDCAYKAQDQFSMQCAIYNKKPFQGWYLQWKPFHKMFNVKEPCKMFCKATAYNYAFIIKHMATDGMKCSNGNSNVCLDGHCKDVGCDLVVGSPAKSDNCGICNGNNSTCKVIKGQYTEQPTNNMYFPIVVLPKASRGITVQEKNSSSSYLAIRNVYGQYYLNGQHQIAWPGIYMLGGTKFMYRRPYNEPETLKTDGPLNEDLVLEILVRGMNPGIMYEYTLLKTPEEMLPTTTIASSSSVYRWALTVSSCSRTCAEGTKVVTATCYMDQEKEVNSTFCDSSKKPQKVKLPCNQKPCPPRWEPEEWRSCSSSCGRGHQVRRVRCKQKTAPNKYRKLKRKFCSNIPRPARKRRCNIQECPPKWHAGKWSECSRSCGQGIRRRRVICRTTDHNHKRFSADQCHGFPQPSKKEHCNIQSCPQIYKWTLTSWSECSNTCGVGIRRRFLRCIKGSGKEVMPASITQCENIPKPQVVLKERCSRGLCHQVLLKPEWHTSIWTACSKSCGPGQQRRYVTCVDPKTQITTHGCDPQQKPATAQSCQLRQCATKDLRCTDQYSWCYLVLQHNACQREIYGVICCKTCQPLMKP